MRTFSKTIVAAVASATVLVPGLTATGSTATASAATTAGSGSAYAAAVLKDNPSAFLQGLQDVTGKTAAGSVVGGSTATTLPNGDPALAFNGSGQYAQFADNQAFEVDATGVLTAEYWMRPDTREFADVEGSGYVYTMGKGSANQHEWYTRMYSNTNSENRPGRISGYVFNPAGGLGSGSYFQDDPKVGEWIHVALVINANAKSSAYPMGYAKIYKNGVLRDTDSLKDYNVTPKSGTAPLRVGTGYLGSFFKGAMGNIAFYNTELSASQVQAHTTAMSQAAPTTPTTPTTPTEPTTPTVSASASRTLNGTNVPRRADQLIRYTRAKGARTGTNAYGAEVIVVDGKITKVTDGVGNAAIPANGFVLSGHGASRTWLKAAAKVGRTVRVSSGTVTIADPAQARKVRRAVTGTNVARTANALVRYTRAKRAATGTNRHGAEVTVINGKVSKIALGVGNAAVPAKGFVLSGHGASRKWLKKFAKVGAKVRVSHGNVTISA